jgi:Fe-S cluster biogenesis protein NfuA
MLGTLNRTRCYLVGSMEFSNGQPWRNYVKEHLKETGIIFFDPYHKPFISSIEEDDEARKDFKNWMQEEQYDKMAKFMRMIRADDLRLCDLSDFFIVQINPQVASWGSAEELTTINRQKKPVFIFIEGGKNKCPIWIMGMIPHKYIYNNVDEILEVINNIHSGAKEIDSDRWHLLKTEYR